MGTNRRSRRRSAARIFHPNGHNKRQKEVIHPPDHVSSPDETVPPKNDRAHTMIFSEMDSNPPNGNLAAQQTPDEEMVDEGLVHHECADNDFNHKADHESVSTSEGDEHLFERDVQETLQNQDSLVKDGTLPFSVAEVCSYQLMSLLDQAGCPLNTYEKVVALLRQQEKIGFSVHQAYSRQKLLQVLRKKYHCPVIESSTVNNCEVFRFPFVDMLQDLLDTAGNQLHHISVLFSVLSNDEYTWKMT